MADPIALANFLQEQLFVLQQMIQPPPVALPPLPAPVALPPLPPRQTMPQWPKPLPRRRPCLELENRGYCYDETCTLLHDACRKYMRYGRCPYGKSCHYVHPKR